MSRSHLIFLIKFFLSNSVKFRTFVTSFAIIKSWDKSMHNKTWMSSNCRKFLHPKAWFRFQFIAIFQRKNIGSENNCQVNENEAPVLLKCRYYCNIDCKSCTEVIQRRNYNPVVEDTTRTIQILLTTSEGLRKNDFWKRRKLESTFTIREPLKVIIQNDSFATCFSIVEIRKMKGSYSLLHVQLMTINLSNLNLWIFTKQVFEKNQSSGVRKHLLFDFEFRACQSKIETISWPDAKQVYSQFDKIKTSSLIRNFKH